MRPALASLVAVAAVATALSPAPASAASRTCRAMAGKTVVSTPSIRIVARQTRATRGREKLTTYVGCAHASGRARRLGYTGGADRGTTDKGWLEGRFSVVKTAGRFVLFRQFTQDDPAGSQLDTRVVVDLRSGARREVWRFAYVESTTCEDVAPEDARYLPPPKQFALGSNGIVAAVHVARPGDRLRECYTPADAAVVVASVPGRTGLRELDRGPVSAIPATSLRLSGRTVRWSHAGEARSATL